MSNNYFKFKQFKIEQENCAMKVCTDSCLFGAWLQPTENVTSILDIGTGTGLLSLMLAQKSTAQIHSIEIDENASLQAKENFDNSVWKDRLHVHLGDIKTFNFPNTFDFIITNPPFFKNEFESEMHSEKIAKHSLHLNLTELLSAIHRLLSDSGKFAILLPFYRKDEFEKMTSELQFYPEKTIFIRQTPAHNFFRYAAVFSNDKSIHLYHEEISIRMANQQYTSEAIDLLKPYYLFL